MIRAKRLLRFMFTVPPCLQRDPGGSDKGDFEGGAGLTMEDNDLYSSWKRGNFYHLSNLCQVNGTDPSHF